MCLAIKNPAANVIRWKGYLWAIKGLVVNKDAQGHYHLFSCYRGQFRYPLTVHKGNIKVLPSPSRQKVDNYYTVLEAGKSHGVKTIDQDVNVAQYRRVLGYHLSFFEKVSDVCYEPMFLVNFNSIFGDFYVLLPVKFKEEDVEATGNSIVVKSFELPKPKELKDLLGMLEEYKEQFNNLGTLDPCRRLYEPQIFSGYSRLFRELKKTIEAKA